jgi:DNA-binding NarL/FixJ family response regulator
MIRVLIVDDQELIRVGLRGILAAVPDFDVDEAADGAAALRRLAQAPTDVILMDIRMPEIDGVETTRRIRTQYGAAGPRILVLTTFENEETVVDAVQAGADGFVGKGIEPADLVASIRSLAEGRSRLSADATDALVRHVSVRPPRTPIDPELVATAEMLTSRERHMVAAVATGLTNDQIAAAEHISRLTVKTHVNRAMAKVGVNDRAQLVSFAFRAGLVNDE